MPYKVSRRNFLVHSLTTSATFYLLPNLVSSPPASAAVETREKPLPLPPPSNLGFFTQAERTILEKLSDQILPGAAAIGVVNYIENLLTAFETDPPRIYAVNPNAGEGTGFVPLSRAQEVGWRFRLYGSKYFSGGWWNEKVMGATKGLREVFKDGAANAPLNENGEPVFDWMPKDFRACLRDAVIEGCFSSPEYGGNYEKRGWQLTYFPGSSQPKGYDYSEVALPDAHDPLPMKFTSKLFMFFVSLFQQGRIYK